MIRIGPAGTPARSTFEGLEVVKGSNLTAMEVEFVYGVRMGNETAKNIGKENEKFNLNLSVHAPYYINLASKEMGKRKASVKRILKSCERAHYMNANPVVFHAAFYQDKDKEECYKIVRNKIEYMQEAIKDNNWNVDLAPEITGKHSQFGSLEELLKLNEETNCSLCVDFAHLEARNNGEIEYEKILKKLKKFEHLHCHFSGINYTDKGEQNHELTDMKKAKKLLKTMVKNNTNATIINESPDPIGDAVKMNEILKKVKK